jgi:hypothetical protein
LVNSTTSIIEDIVWKESANIKKDPPQSLLIAVDNYDGPVLFTRKNGKNVILIFPVLYKWEGTKGTYLWHQFTAALAFTITVYKS